MINQVHALPRNIEGLKQYTLEQPQPVWKRVTLPENLFERPVESSVQVVVDEGKDHDLSESGELTGYYVLTPEDLENHRNLPINQETLQQLWFLNDNGQKGMGNEFTSFAISEFNVGGLAYAKARETKRIKIGHLLDGGATVAHYLVYAEAGANLEVVLDFYEEDEEIRQEGASEKGEEGDRVGGEGKGESEIDKGQGQEKDSVDLANASVSTLYTQISVLAKAGATVKVTNLQRLGETSRSFQSITTLAEEGASVTVGDLQLGGALKASSVHQRLNGRHADVKTYGLYYGAPDSQTDISYTLNHGAKKTTGHILAKGALDHNSKKVFRGNLMFDQGASASVGKQEEFVMLLSEKLQSDSIPGLFCKEDDVIGEHAASVGQVDGGKLFYLMSRGFSEAAARKLLIRAAYEAVLIKLEEPEVAAAVSQLLDRRLDPESQVVDLYPKTNEGQLGA